MQKTQLNPTEVKVQPSSQERNRNREMRGSSNGDALGWETISQCHEQVQLLPLETLVAVKINTLAQAVGRTDPDLTLASAHHWTIYEMEF